MRSVERDSWARLNPHDSGLLAEPDEMRGITGVYKDLGDVLKLFNFFTQMAGS